MKRSCFFIALSLVICLCGCTNPSTAGITKPVCGDGHLWTAADCNHPQTCSVCDATLGEPKHCWQPASCSILTTCAICGITAGKAAEHTFSDWVVDTRECLSRYCYLCGQEESHVLMEAVYTDMLYEQTKEFLAGTWTAKLVVDDTNSRYSLPQEAYTLDIQLRKNDQWSWLEWEASFVNRTSDINLWPIRMEYSELSRYGVLYTDENGQQIYDWMGMPYYMPKLLSEMLCYKYTIERADEVDADGAHLAKTVLYDLILYYTPEFPNGLMEVVMHKEQQRVFFTKDDPENPGENPFCKVVID